MPLLRVTAYLEAPIASRDEIHLDAILTDRARRFVESAERVSRSMPASEIPQCSLPIVVRTFGGDTCCLASAMILPETARRGRENFVSRKDPEDIYHMARAWTPGTGPEKNYCMPLPTIETPAVSWLVIGTRKPLMGLLRTAKQVGDMRRQGYGVVREWVVDRVEDVPLERVLVDSQGWAARHLPASWVASSEYRDEGPCQAPYWHPGRSTARVRRGVRCELHPRVLEIVRSCR